MVKMKKEYDWQLQLEQYYNYRANLRELSEKHPGEYFLMIGKRKLGIFKTKKARNKALRGHEKYKAGSCKIPTQKQYSELTDEKASERVDTAYIRKIAINQSLEIITEKDLNIKELLKSLDEKNN